MRGPRHVFIGSAAWLLLTHGDALAQTVTQARTITVYDANGQRVGRARDAATGAVNDPFRIAYRVEGNITYLLVSRSRVQGSAGETLLFASTDCTGAPFIEMQDDPMVSASVVRPDGSLYFAPQGQVQTFTYNSAVNDEGCSPVVPPASNTVSAAPVSLIYALPFVPPFSVR